MKVLVVGANGQIGQHVVSKLQKSEKHDVVAMVRKKEQADSFNQQGIETALVDLEGSINDITSAVQGSDAVVFTAGSGGATGADKTMLIDLDGAIKSMKATQQANVKRFVLVSAIGIQNYHEENHLDWIDRSSYYSAAKYYADVWLENSNLDYTIVRPGGLTNEQGTGEVSVSEELDFEKIPREDVASAIILSLENDGTIGKAFDITSGDTAIEKAIQSF